MLYQALEHKLSEHTLLPEPVFPLALHKSGRQTTPLIHQELGKPVYPTNPYFSLAVPVFPIECSLFPYERNDSGFIQLFGFCQQQSLILSMTTVCAGYISKALSGTYLQISFASSSIALFSVELMSSETDHVDAETPSFPANHQHQCCC